MGQTPCVVFFFRAFSFFLVQHNNPSSYDAGLDYWDYSPYFYLWIITWLKGTIDIDFAWQLSFDSVAQFPAFISTFVSSVRFTALTLLNREDTTEYSCLSWIQHFQWDEQVSESFSKI